MTELLLLAALLVIGVVQTTLLIVVLRRKPTVPPPCRFSPETMMAMFERSPDETPSPLATIRHEHRFGPKDADGIRHCRCGDRYLDAMRVG